MYLYLNKPISLNVGDNNFCAGILCDGDLGEIHFRLIFQRYSQLLLWCGDVWLENLVAQRFVQIDRSDRSDLLMVEFSVESYNIVDLSFICDNFGLKNKK